MHWITIIWSMVAAASLTLALVHFIVWIRRRDRYAHLCFAAVAVAVAAYTLCDVGFTTAKTPAQFIQAMWLVEFAIMGYFVSLVVFVRTYLKAGPLWLGLTAIALRGIFLAFDIPAKGCVNYTAVDRIDHVSVLGEAVAIPEGVLSPMRRLGELSELGLFVFLTLTTITVWRRGERRKAMLTSGSNATFLLLGAGQAALVFHGLLPPPILVVPSFLLVVVAMSFELSSEVLRAAELTETVQAREAQLRENEQRTDLAAQAADLGHWVWDIASNEIWATEKTRSLYGLDPQERVTFDRFLQTLLPDDRVIVQQQVTRSIESNDDFHVEYRVVLPDGAIRWIAARGRFDGEQQRMPNRMFGVSLDITRRKFAEMESARQRNELAHLSRVTMLGELSGALAHELNQPLASILSNAQAAQRFMAQDNADLAEVRDILQDIVDEDVRAGEVIRRLRLLLKKGEVQMEPLNINDLLLDVLRLMRSDLINHGVIARTDLSPELPLIAGDRVQLQQVLLNLVMNACDAMAQSLPAERQIEIATAQGDEPGVHLRIVDQGTGIPADDLHRIFEPFVTSKTAGMGLGLAVCRTIISVHGGVLWAVNNPDRGATFHLTLPAGNGAA